MVRRVWRMAPWAVMCGAVLAAAIIFPLWVTAGSGEPGLTATLYSDVIRFEADGVASLRLTVYDLAENELWTSGLIPGDFIDWDRTNAAGERLANGYYLYLAQGWDTSDSLILNKAGKVVLLPGDQVELKAAPSVGGAPAGSSSDEPIYQPMAYDTTNWYVSNRLGVGTDSPQDPLDVHGYIRCYYLREESTTPQMRWYETDAADDPNDYFRHEYGGNKYRMQWRDDSAGTWFNALVADGNTGNVGIGTINPWSPLHIEDADGSSLFDVTIRNSGNTQWGGLYIGGDGDTMTYSVVTLSDLGSPYHSWTIAHKQDPNVAHFLLFAYNVEGVGEAQIMVLDPSGKVGIGTTGPSAALTVESGDASNPAILGTNTNGYNGVLGSADGALAGVCGFNNGAPGGPGLFGWSYNGSGLLANSANGANIIEARDGNGTTGNFGDDITRFRVERDGDVYVDGELTVGAYTLPNTDGAAGEVLTTDGGGTLSWAASGGGSVDSSALWERLSYKEEDIEALRGQLADAQEEISELRSQVNALMERLEAVERVLAEQE